MNPHFFTAPFVRFLRFAPSAAPPYYENNELCAATSLGSEGSKGLARRIKLRKRIDRRYDVPLSNFTPLGITDLGDTARIA